MRILHISDLHAARFDSPRALIAAFEGKQRLQEAIETSPPGKRMQRGRQTGIRSPFLNRPAVEAHLRAVERAARIEAASADVVVVSGDVSDTGHRVDLTAAQESLDRTLAGARVGTPVVLIPGNHDRYCMESPWPFRPGGRTFDSVFGERWVGSQFAPVVHRFDLEEAAISLVAADFSLRNSRAGAAAAIREWPGRGRAHADLLRKVIECTLRERALARHVIWVVHFAPAFPYSAAEFKDDYFLRFSGGESILKAAASDACAVTHILCGHTHRAMRYCRPAGPEVICAGTASAHPSDGVRSFMVVDLALDAGRLATTRCRKLGMAAGMGVVPFSDLGEEALKTV